MDITAVDIAVSGHRIQRHLTAAHMDLVAFVVNTIQERKHSLNAAEGAVSLRLYLFPVE